MRWIRWPTHPRRLRMTPHLSRLRERVDKKDAPITDDSSWWAKPAYSRKMPRSHNSTTADKIVLKPMTFVHVTLNILDVVIRDEKLQSR